MLWTYCGCVIESDAGAGERLLHESRDPISIAVGRDRDWTTLVQFGQRGTDVPSDGMRIAALGDLAVLDVPPHRRLRRHVLLLRRERGRTRHCAFVSFFLFFFCFLLLPPSPDLLGHLCFRTPLYCEQGP